ncbi:epoxyqueuosine reductase QueH [Caproiciproducens faecalis]|uniref:Epoxyqueuosine reductase QueH n=1 Tax=Caproiciproducens faecalis TaxID=2820301 RepID=A0ABS7DPB8_9FIRM|nr:epoxyqueuosine reductase QueH [Caproiciproducens faecalis]MBW7572946.1 epoxyqueuosine reductase QueH [Caproiciproducens faecalis]
MVKINYQKELDGVISGLHGEAPTLLLHACCAPCSSYVLEYLSDYFHITLFYYNPNISPEGEYRKRVEEVKRLIAALPVKHPVSFLEGNYDTDRFFALANGHEAEPEGGERCFACYSLRLREAAQAAKAGGFDYFTTTLSISPYKNAEKLNAIGAELEKEFGVRYLYSDFKKKNGYKRSIELSEQYDLYRQDYCGCVFSKAEHERRLKVQNFSTPDGQPVENLPS